MEEPKRVLIVDDEEQNCELLEAMIESLGHESRIARDGMEAIANLKSDIDLVLLDVMMPKMDGFEVAHRIRAGSDFNDVPIIMVTALTAKEDRLRAVEAGANDFIAKPVDRTELRVRTTSLLKVKEAQDAIKHYQAELEEKVRQRTADLRQALDDTVEAQHRTHEAHLDMIQRLAVAAEYKDEDTGAHIQRMSRYSVLLATKINLSEDEVNLILNSSPMHDVGKIGIPETILLKPDSLTEEEWVVMKEHTTMGSNILSGSSSELLKAGEVIALSHHEKWDGSGYPNGLVGKDIPLWGRICAVADVFDALTSERPYKKAYSNENAVGMMKEGRGSHFDPDLLDLFFENIDEIVEVQKEYQ